MGLTTDTLCGIVFRWALCLRNARNCCSGPRGDNHRTAVGRLAILYVTLTGRSRHVVFNYSSSLGVNSGGREAFFPGGSFRRGGDVLSKTITNLCNIPTLYLCLPTMTVMSEASGQLNNFDRFFITLAVLSNRWDFLGLTASVTSPGALSSRPPRRFPSLNWSRRKVEWGMLAA